MSEVVIKTKRATPLIVVDWHSINWKNCHYVVKNLQSRIIKAYQEGRLGKVKALQGILTHSFSAKAIAVKRVTELNTGKKTPGVDKELWDTPTKKADALLNKLNRSGYKAFPLKRVYIPKSNGKKRPLEIPTMRDRAMQMLYQMALDPVAEEIADNNSYGFRQKRGCTDAIEQCFNSLAKISSTQWILEGDIKSCFDKINHDFVLANTPSDTKMLKEWLKCGLIDKGMYSLTTEGTPQGGIISPTLANLTLDGMEDLLKKNFKPSKPFNPKVNLVRYADDFIITGTTKELLENEVKPLIISFLKERGLELSAEKTHITHINEGFDFLGQNIRKYNGKLLIKPSKKNIKTFLDKVREMIKSNKTAKQENLIQTLNPMIRGWANYHRYVVSKETFSKVKSEIFKMIWNWCKRRHPNKPKLWIKDRYFIRVKNKDWIFAFNINQQINMADTPIVRHVKIKGNANPYDPQFEEYFEKREFTKMRKSIKGYGRLATVWMRQDGKCPICGEIITLESQWHLHHIIPKHLGGTDTLDNLVSLHPNCHRLVHSKKIDMSAS